MNAYKSLSENMQMVYLPHTYKRLLDLLKFRATFWCQGPWRELYIVKRWRNIACGDIRQAPSLFWLWVRMVFVSVPCRPPLLLSPFFSVMLTLLLSSFLAGFLCPLFWYYATFLYLCNHYRKDPRERAGLAASAIAVKLSLSLSLSMLRKNWRSGVIWE